MNRWEMKRWVGVLGFAMSFVIVTVTTQQAVFAQNGSDAKSNARHSRIVGLWDVEVSVLDCNSGDPVNSFVAMHQYHLGGTGEIVPAGNPTGLSAHLMIWSYKGGDNYLATAKFFRYDAGGSMVGWTILRNDITLSRDGNEYIGSGVAEFYTPMGGYLFSFCPEIIATRITEN